MPLERQNEEILTLTADTEEDCREKLFKMYGSNYTIVERKNIAQNYGLLGLFKKPAVQIRFMAKGRSKPQDEFPLDEDGQRAIREEILRRATGGKSKTEIKIDEIYSKLEELSQNVKTMPRASSEETPESIIRIEELLEDNEFTKEFITDITSRLKKEFSLDDLKNFSKVERQVIDWIGEAIEISVPKHARPPRVVVIVGPTGVGKTTTIGKLAAQNVMRSKKSGDSKTLSIALVTIDKTRIGAEKQLQTFGEVLDLQVYKAEDSDDLKEIFNSIKYDNDIIYIDTSGYSPNDSENIAKLKNTLSVEGLKPEIFLAVAADKKARDLRNIMQNYEPFGYSSVIVTKCDETTGFGNIISVLNEKRKSISYITDGQVISRNIQKANVVDFLIRLSGFTVDRIHIEEKFGDGEK